MNVTQADRDGALRSARPRTERRTRGTGIYRVTVGGIVVGTVRRSSTPVPVWIACPDESDSALIDPDRSFGGGNGSTYSTRKEAVTRLARTESAAQAYRESAREGVQGTAEERRVRDECAAELVAIDAQLAARDVDSRPEATLPKREQVLVIATAEALPGDRLVTVEGEDLGALGPVVLEAARPVYGDSGPLGVRITGPRTHVNFLDVEQIETITVARLVTA